MRKVIWRMSEGQFSETVPRIYLEPEVINETIVENETFNGSFSVLCDKNCPNKGLIYCDHPYIYIDNPAFNEDNSLITYKINAKYLHKNDCLKGFFYIYSQNQVKKLPFTITVKKQYPISSIGEINNIDAFAELAKRSFSEALGIFYSDEFKSIIENSSKDVKLLYKGFSFAQKSESNLEEFLVESGCKERVYFDLNTSKREYTFVSANIKESIDITRNTWGYIRLEATTDCNFISVENNLITGDFFLGSKLTLNYYIHKERLHKGRNYGQIIISGMGIVRKIEIVATTSDLYERSNSEYIDGKKVFLDLYKTYESFRLKHITALDWSDRTIEYIDELLKGDIKDRIFYKLIKTHALIVKNDVKLALDYIKSLRVDIVDKKSCEWAYLLYLGALIEPEEDYVNKLRKEVELIQSNHPEDVRIFWFLLFLKKEYIKDCNLKLRAIKHWINEGFDSPILYVECYEIFKDNPYLLDSFSPFNLKIIIWAIKRNGLSNVLSERLFDLILKENGFSDNILSILVKAYEHLPNDIHLKHIISYMLKGNARNEKYAEIYKLGIDSGIKLTGLFEAYIESLPLNYMDKLSDIVLRYFSYNSNISDERKALIYANIIMYKKEDPTIYEIYKPNIKEFCLEQIKVGRLDDNLSVCFQDLLDDRIIDSRISDNIIKHLFAKKVICLHKNARRIVLVEDELKEPVYSNIVGNISFIPIFSKNNRIFIEMVDGSLTCDEKIFYIEDTLNTRENYDALLKGSTDRKLFFMHDLPDMENRGQILDVYEEEAIGFLFDDSIDSEYISNNISMFINFFKDHLREDIILSSLLHNNRYKDFGIGVLTYLSNLLIIDGEDEKAIKLINEHIITGYDKRQMLLCLRRYVTDPTKSYGEFILELAISLLREGYHSDETIEYLLNHFIGLSDDMRLVFKYADRESPAIRDFCERFLVQSLYSGAIKKEDDDILITYLSNNPNPMIVEAYISYFSHLYLVKDEELPNSVMAILIRQLGITDSVNDVCKFALCKYLCNKGDLTKREEEVFFILIPSLLSRNIYFPFYANMKKEYIIKFHLYDKVYISVATDSGKDLMISICNDNDKYDIDIPENYHGIYVKDVVLFFGETINYIIYEKNNKDTPLLSGEYTYQDVDYLDESRFLRINNMQENLFYKEFSSLKEDIALYNKEIDAVNKLFYSL